ncbi:MAG: hypothetical protein NZ899_01375 [Thermoguttaceae bacterium]|nr:hypothetical protein [Thermoguttaceae bacterium]MDW8077543.1 hypothetical protein [Thermoguttaceae bacterium]
MREPFLLRLAKLWRLLRRDRDTAKANAGSIADLDSFRGYVASVALTVTPWYIGQTHYVND